MGRAAPSGTLRRSLATGLKRIDGGFGGGGTPHPTLTALLTRLRIAGFKSFAEPAALDILPGLTGIVGPNGCGKSNVVEALRWAMGESSARIPARRRNG